MRKPVTDADGVVIQNERGHEVPDPVPLSIPAGFKRPETLTEQVQRLVRHSMSEYARTKGAESFEEADDFDVDDDFDPTTPYEVFFDPVLNKEISHDEFVKHQNRFREEIAIRERNMIRLEEQEAALEAAKQEGRQGRKAARQEPPKKPGGGGSAPRMPLRAPLGPLAEHSSGRPLGGPFICTIHTPCRVLC